MKKTCALLLLALPVAASAGDWSISLRGGPSRSDQGANDLREALAERGHSATTEVDAHSAAAIAAVGYRINRLLTLEASLGTLGNYEATATATPSNAAAFARDFAGHRPAGGEFIGVGLRQDLPLMRDIALTTRIGGFGWQLDSDSSGRDDDGIGLMLGLALRYAPAGRWAFAIGGDHFDQGDHGVIGVLHAGLEYRLSD